jgi:hypothetical protein
MNSLVKSFCVGRNASEKVKIYRVWERIHSRRKKIIEDKGLNLPVFGASALEFVREMKRMGIDRVGRAE